MAKDIRVEIGFVGGGNTAVDLPEDQLDGFTGSLQAVGDDKWFSVTSSDGATFHLDLSKVVFVRIASNTRAIGFSHA